jgi:hypothetical protein
LSQPFQHGRKVCSIDVLYLIVAAAQGEHRKRNLVLRVRR